MITAFKNINTPDKASEYDACPVMDIILVLTWVLR